MKGIKIQVHASFLWNGPETWLPARIDMLMNVCSFPLMRRGAGYSSNEVLIVRIHLGIPVLKDSGVPYGI